MDIFRYYLLPNSTVWKISHLKYKYVQVKNKCTSNVFIWVFFMPVSFDFYKLQDPAAITIYKN